MVSNPIGVWILYIHFARRNSKRHIAVLLLKSSSYGNKPVRTIPEWTTGAELDTSWVTASSRSLNVAYTQLEVSPVNAIDKRATERRAVALPARLTWKDQQGTLRFALAVTRDVSEYGVFVECQSPVSIPLYRLVQIQVERQRQSGDGIPPALRQGRVLSAVYRIAAPATTGQGHGFALRLMVEPKRRLSPMSEARATA
jgi:hypothetical protein